MSIYRVSRRSFTASATGMAAGIFATSRLGRSALAQDAMPSGEIQPVGFVSMRVRTLESEEQRSSANGFVLDGFAADVAALDGYQGYLLGDVIDAPNESVTVVVLNEASQEAGFNEVASEFVASIADDAVVTGTQHWAGDLVITGSPEGDAATPAADGAAMTSGYVAVRVHTSLPGTDPHDFVPLATSDFLPIVAGLDGFLGYLWFPVEGGFAAITLYDSEASAEASNEAAREWAAEFLAEYTDGNPQIINANVIYADLPILG